MSTEPGLPRRRDEAPPQDDSPPGPERLLALSDEIVAIALTLLILDLKVPATSLLRHPRLGVQPDRAARARHRPADQLRGVVLRHHPVLAHAPPGIPRGHRAQRRAGLVEFRVPVHHHADPVHQRPARSVRGNPLAVDIFAANILLGSLASLATAKFIKRKGLASAAYNQEQARAGQIRALSVAAIIAVSMAVAWQNPDTAKYLWILIAFLPDIVIRATRRRPGPPPAAPDPVTG